MKVILIEAVPVTADGTGSAQVRLAGGGRSAYTYKGFNDWRGGVANEPRFTTAIGFDETGWTGGAIPQTSTLRFFPSDPDLVEQLASLYWIKCPVLISIGDDDVSPIVWKTALNGTVADMSIDAGAITFTLSDLSGDLKKQAVPDTYAGTGGLEGDATLTGAVKRRSWGAVFNVEGKIANAAYNIYEFGDPARPLQDMPLIKDKGAPYTSQTLVAWQGTADSTLTALENATVPDGGVCYAPSIARAKPWAQPAGPITADMLGETAGGYTDRPGGIVTRLIAAYSSIGGGDLSNVDAGRPYQCGLHCDDSSETVQNILDRLLLPISLVWAMTPGGVLQITPFSWDGPVESLTAEEISRKTVFPPLLSRKLGFQKNQRIQSDGEISAAIDTTSSAYEDGTPIDELRPAEAGANVTGSHTAAAIAGQGSLATLSSVGLYSPQITGLPSAIQQSNLVGGQYISASFTYNPSSGYQLTAYWPATTGADQTSGGISAGFNGQSAWATFTLVNPSTAASSDYPGYFTAANIAFSAGSGGNNLQSLRPAEYGANVTGTNISAGFSGQTAWATLSFSTGRVGQLDDSGYMQASFVYKPYVDYLTNVWPAQAGADKTGLNQASSIANQGAFATQTNIDLTNSFFFSYSGRFRSIDNGDSNYFPAVSIIFGSNSTSYRFLVNLEPQEAGANVTEIRVAIAISGQGRGATSNNLNDLDPTAASQLASAANGGRQTAPLNTSLYKTLASGGSLVVECDVATLDNVSTNGTIFAQIWVGAPGSLGLVAESGGASYGSGEPDGDSVTYTISNSSGGSVTYEIQGRMRNTGAAIQSKPSASRVLA